MRRNKLNAEKNFQNDKILTHIGHKREIDQRRKREKWKEIERQKEE